MTVGQLGLLIIVFVVGICLFDVGLELPGIYFMLIPVCVVAIYLLCTYTDFKVVIMKIVELLQKKII